MPAVAPIQTPPVVITGQGDSGEHRLVAELSQNERGDVGEQHVSRFGDLDSLVVVARATLPPCPHREQQEGDGGGERDGSLRQREPKEMADRHRKPVYQDRCDANAGQHHPPPVAQGIGHGHQLRFVAEFGDKYHGQADECGGEHGDDLSTRRRRANCSRPARLRSKVSPTALRFAGRAVRQYVDSTIGGYSPSLTSSTIATVEQARRSPR
jgi:hypothetical protein